MIYLLCKNELDIVNIVAWMTSPATQHGGSRGMENAGLTVKPKKCSFDKTEVSYLGHTVGNGKVAPMHDKIQAVRDVQVQVNLFIIK